MESYDELFDSLLEITREMLDAVKQEDVDSLSDAVDARQSILESLSAQKGRGMTDAQRARYDEIVSLDKKVGAMANGLFEKIRVELRESNVKYEGMSRYNQSRYGLSSGLSMDKKR